MKKVLAYLTIILFCFAVSVSAQTWHTADQKTVGWDAVTANTNGDIVPADQISYTVYLYNAVTDPAHLNAVTLGSTVETQYLITLGVEGRYFWGVKSVRTIEGDVVGESAIIWTSLPEYDFGIQFYFAPMEPGGLN